jgi:hypothetical protein
LSTLNHLTFTIISAPTLISQNILSSEICFQFAIMKSVLCLAIAVLAALHGAGITAAPTPDAAPEAEAGQTHISYTALAGDRVPSSGGAATPANPYDRGCTVEERCFRDTGKRSKVVQEWQVG